MSLWQHQLNFTVFGFVKINHWYNNFMEKTSIA